MFSHEADILEDLLTNASHVSLAESQELVILTNCLQIDIFETVFHCEGHMDLAIDYATFQIKFAYLLFDLHEKISHEQDVDFLDIFHLDGVDTIDLSDETLWILTDMV